MARWRPTGLLLACLVGILLLLGVAYAVVAYLLESEGRAWAMNALEQTAMARADELAAQLPAVPPEAGPQPEPAAWADACRSVFGTGHPPLVGRAPLRALALVLPDAAVPCAAGLLDARALRPAGMAEVRRALQGQPAASVRPLVAGDPDDVVVAVPVYRGGDVIGALFAAMPYRPDAALHGLIALAFVAVAVLIVVALLSGAALLRYWIASSVEVLQEAVRRFGAGEPGARVALADSDPLRPLARALNQTGVALEASRVSLAQRLNEREAVLASMMEGVLAVDTEQRLIDINPTAAEMLGVQPAAARGRHLIEVVRNPTLQAFTRETLAGHGPMERELELSGAGERIVQAHGTPLRDQPGRTLGALVVLNDVTRLHRLENMRRDFVANVSHELKTPITSIKGFVETLLDGAVDDPEDARRFLGIIARHSDRLGTIIDDLLNLSRIEQEAERERLHTEEVPLRELLQSASQVCAMKAREKDIAVELDCPAGLRAALNAALAEQALVNLVDNAIKYSPPHSQVRLFAEPGAGEVSLGVQDRGPGIEAEHLPRLFERFYRVDKARSRKLGGTGLGLAIVKHIAQAHGGRVEVESEPGRGSTFRLHFPQPPRPRAA